MKPNNEILGKFRRDTGKPCPDCEASSTQERDLNGVLFIVCPSCGYKNTDDAHNKANIRKMRDVKNGKTKVRDKRISPTRSSYNK